MSTREVRLNVHLRASVSIPDDCPKDRIVEYAWRRVMKNSEKWAGAGISNVTVVLPEKMRGLARSD